MKKFIYRSLAVAALSCCASFASAGVIISTFLAGGQKEVVTSQITYSTDRVEISFTAIDESFTGKVIGIGEYTCVFPDQVRCWADFFGYLQIEDQRIPFIDYVAGRSQFGTDLQLTTSGTISGWANFPSGTFFGDVHLDSQLATPVPAAPIWTLLLAAILVFLTVRHYLKKEH